MTYSTIQLEVSDGVARITLNRPDAFNALNLGMMKELCDVANRCSSDKTVRVVVITGAGSKAFCAGGDVAEFAQDPTNIELLLKEMTGYLHTAISRFAWMRAPLIACVNGAAAGGGLSLVACADLVIASDTARFTSAYTQIGFTPDGSSTYFLSRIIGIRRATELYLTNRVLSAQQALDWGLVNRVVPADALEIEVDALATQLAQGPTRAYGGIKKLLMTAPQDSLESQMEREGRLLVEMATNSDGLEGVQAFIQKRQPKFHGI